MSATWALFWIVAECVYSIGLVITLFKYWLRRAGDFEWEEWSGHQSHLYNKN